MLNRPTSRFPAISELLPEDAYWLRNLQNDLFELQKRDSEIKKCETSYSIAKLSDTCVRILINIIPKEGPFLNYEFQFKTYLKKDFPFKPLQIFSQYHVYHPNIHSETREICLPLLSKEMWSPNTSLYIIILSLEFMVLEPNFYLIPNTVQNIECALLFQKDANSFKRKFRQLSFGGEKVFTEMDDELENNGKKRFIEQFENFKSPALEIEMEGRELENGINNLNINPKKRRFEGGQEKMQLKKFH